MLKVLPKFLLWTLIALVSTQPICQQPSESANVNSKPKLERALFGMGCFGGANMCSVKYQE